MSYILDELACYVERKKIASSLDLSSSLGYAATHHWSYPRTANGDKWSRGHNQRITRVK